MPAAPAAGRTPSHRAQHRHDDHRSIQGRRRRLAADQAAPAPGVRRGAQVAGKRGVLRSRRRSTSSASIPTTPKPTKRGRPPRSARSTTPRCAISSCTCTACSIPRLTGPRPAARETFAQLSANRRVAAGGVAAPWLVVDGGSWHIAPARRRGLGRGGRTQEDQVEQGPPDRSGRATCCAALPTTGCGRNGARSPWPCAGPRASLHPRRAIPPSSSSRSIRCWRPTARRCRGCSSRWWHHGLPRPLPLSASDHGHTRGDPHRDERAEGRVRPPHERRLRAPHPRDHGAAGLAPDQRPRRHPARGADRARRPRQGHPDRRRAGRGDALPRLGDDPGRAGRRPAGGHTPAPAGHAPEVAGAGAPRPRWAA